MKDLLKVGLRQNAVYVGVENERPTTHENKTVMTGTTSQLVSTAANWGFGFSEELLDAVNQLHAKQQLDILKALKDVMGIKKNWTPLVKGWDVPTGESLVDHVITFFANVFGSRKGTQLPCGHLIPQGTFPLERYNGCPFCKTPFSFGELEKVGQNKDLKILELWTEKDARAFFEDLLTSKTALDATQVDSLKILVKQFELPKVDISMKETVMLVIDELIASDEGEKAKALFSGPNDILRYLWYKKTGYLQIVRPATIIQNKSKNSAHLHPPSNESLEAADKATQELKLKYSRPQCKMVANWLNELPMDAQRACQLMHSKRGMWVRFIRALRLTEYSKRPGFQKLAAILDIFYNKQYQVWEAKLDACRSAFDADGAFELLKQRPGMFARSLFANMLWFGAEPTSIAFMEVIDKVPARLLLTLNMYAKNYFDPGVQRSIKTITGRRKRIPANKMLEIYSEKKLDGMKAAVENLCLASMKDRFSKQENDSETMYIDDILFKMPVAIGERSETIQDLPVALMGTRFPVKGDTVRLFMQWGNGLKAQHLDMDLSAQLAYADGKLDICSYSRLVTTGCKHSGDIIKIPAQVGTAEYIDVNIRELRAADVKFVSFTCNAYSKGNISTGLVVGWMNAKHKMSISKKTGVAYDPSCVQHQVRITQTLTKGLVFGVLDVDKAEIVWMEMSFGGQVVQGLNYSGVKAMLAKLDSRFSIGELLRLKAKAQTIKIVDSAAADEIYDQDWARNAAAVTQLLVD